MKCEEQRPGEMPAFLPRWPAPTIGDFRFQSSLELRVDKFKGQVQSNKQELLEFQHLTFQTKY